MSFWSSETLLERLDTVIAPFDKAQIDCSAYTLRMGAEVYVSPASGKRKDSMNSIRSLKERESFALPPGQFAFLLTEERLLVPNECLAFISIRASLKLRGLLNVSGFHVDPGYSGRLVFGVINAGPAAIHIARGDLCFLIWFSELDDPTKLGRIKPGYERITSELVSNISGEFKTIEGLSKRIDTLEVKWRIVAATVAIMTTLLIGILLKLLVPSPTSTNPIIMLQPAATSTFPPAPQTTKS